MHVFLFGCYFQIWHLPSERTGQGEGRPPGSQGSAYQFLLAHITKQQGLLSLVLSFFFFFSPLCLNMPNTKGAKFSSYLQETWNGLSAIDTNRPRNHPATSWNHSKGVPPAGPNDNTDWAQQDLMYTLCSNQEPVNNAPGSAGKRPTAQHLGLSS